MTQEEIKKKCENQYESIRKAEATLNKLRSICKHKSFSLVTYSYRVGHAENAKICFHCGHLLEYA